jgi:hypothetical protein
MRVNQNILQIIVIVVHAGGSGDIMLTVMELML